MNVGLRGRNRLSVQLVFVGKLHYGIARCVSQTEAA